MTEPEKFEFDIFLSYNRADEEWTRKLATRLERETHKGGKLRVFFAPWDIRPGQPFLKIMEEALEKSRKVGIVMSPESLKSDWVELERLGATYISTKEVGDRVIPIYLKDCEPPTFLAQLSRIDFRDASAYEAGYRLLLTVIRDDPLPRGESEKEDLSVVLRAPIPEPSVEFVSRQDEHGKDMLGKILEAVRRRQSGLIVLFGDGGRGKTTLAVETIRALAGTYRIAWASADGREDFSLSTLLDDIASQLGAHELRKETLEAKKEALQAVLSDGLTLIVLDNFETVSDPEQKNCISWLSKSAPCPSLITTRQRIPAVLNIRVDEMTGEEARLFIERLIEQANDPDTFKGLDLDSVSKAAEYNPLIIGWIVGQIDLAQSYDQVLSDLSKGKGDAATRVFDRSFDLPQLTDDGRDALLSLSFFVPSASRVALAEVAGFGEDTDRLNEAVKRLAALRLIKSIDIGNRLAVEGLTRDFASARLSKDARAAEFRSRFTQYFLSYSEARAELTAENHDALESEKDNLLSAIEVAFGQQDWPTVMMMVKIVAWQLNSVLYLRGYWDEVTRYGEQALEAARNSQSEEQVALFAHNLAMAYQDRGELDKARRLYTESIEISKKLGNQSGIAITLHELGRLAQDQGEVNEARRLYNESIEISKKLGSQRGIASTLNELGRLAQAQGKLDEARKLYNESLGINRQFDNWSIIAITLHNLATIAQVQGDFGQARRLYDESLDISKRLGDPGNIALMLYNMGTLIEAEGNREEAARLFSEALRIFEKLRSPYAENARESLARVTD
ncbi:MAG TPA: tetratricopeptide repeat protein [Blastocatellia bacterium]|nr:tetratricopeptide repeat protein [Blastocatellia bacterium]